MSNIKAKVGERTINLPADTVTEPYGRTYTQVQQGQGEKKLKIVRGGVNGPTTVTLTKSIGRDDYFTELETAVEFTLFIIEVAQNPDPKKPGKMVEEELWQTTFPECVVLQRMQDPAHGRESIVVGTASSFTREPLFEMPAVVAG